MADEPEAPGRTAISVLPAQGVLDAAFMDGVVAATRAGDWARVREMVAPLHEADLADLIQGLPSADRTAFIRGLGDDFDFTALTEIDEDTRSRILDELHPHELVEGVRDLESDDAVTILEDLDPPEQAEVLAGISPQDRAAVMRALDYPEGSAARLMQGDFIAVAPSWTVGQTIDYMRDADDLPDEFYELFVVDARRAPVGAVSLNRLLRSKRPTTISDIAHPLPAVVDAADDEQEVARVFERYNLVSAPVVDSAGRMIGVVTVDDVVDVIREEGSDEVNRLVGVDAQAMAKLTPLAAASRRLPWLLATMGIELLAGVVVAIFDQTLQRVILLASFMPVISAISGNVGLQAAAITVRGLDTGYVPGGRTGAAVAKEMATTVFMALACGLVLGAVGVFWSRRLPFGIVIGGALFAAMLTASVMGTVFPIVSKRLGFDPAATAGPFETAFQDLVGFAVFLWLATLLLDIIA